MVGCNHDDYSMWFHVTPHNSNLLSPPPSLSLERPVCTCGMHTAWSRTRIAMHNNTTRNELYLSAMTQVHTYNTPMKSHTHVNRSHTDTLNLRTHSFLRHYLRDQVYCVLVMALFCLY